MRKLKLNAIAALFAAAALTACGGGGGGEQVVGVPSPAPSPGPAPAPGPGPAPGPAPAPAPSAPVNSVSSGSVSVSATATLIFSSGNGNVISVDDVDGGSLTTSLIVGDGSLEMASGSGATITGDRTGSVTVMGTIAQINAALNGMVYTAPSTAQTLDLQILTQDGTTPTPLSDTDQVTITVEAPASAPTPSAPVNAVGRSSVAASAGGTLTFNSGNGNLISVDDVDGGSLATSLAVGAGTLAMASGSGATITGNGTSNVRVAGTIAQINAALNGMVYTAPAAAQSVFLQILTQDGTAPTPLSDADQVTINVTAAEFRSNQDASIVLGQPNFGSGAGGSPTQSNLLSPAGAVAVSNFGRVYVPDTGHNRVLVFRDDAVNGDLAVSVRGQVDFTTAALIVNQGRHPQAAHVAIGGNRMAVAEPFANRVSLFDRPPTSSFQQPVSLIGQVSWTDPSTSCAAKQLAQPRAVAITPDGSKVLVADTGNNRVNIYNNFPFALVEPATDIVLGQDQIGGGFSCLPNREAGIVGANTLQQPTGVWTDGTRVVVADTANHRVLIWTSFPTAVSAAREGEPADIVLGQGNFSANLPNRGGNAFDNTLRGPTHVASDGVRLAVADTDNHRVLIWTTFPTTDGAPANVVLGQSTFLTRQPNGGLGAPTIRRFSSPTGLHFNDGKLYVTDRDNNRVLIFEPQ